MNSPPFQENTTPPHLTENQFLSQKYIITHSSFIHLNNHFSQLILDQISHKSITTLLSYLSNFSLSQVTTTPTPLLKYHSLSHDSNNITSPLCYHSLSNPHLNNSILYPPSPRYKISPLLHFLTHKPHRILFPIILTLQNHIT
jgi:hypothetical protein